ncbi:hypothetical protein ACFL6S_33375 [Candidatus Poribacteria bacterium]
MEQPGMGAGIDVLHTASNRHAGRIIAPLCRSVPLFIARKTKPIWLDEGILRQHLEAEYRPGEPNL